MISALYDLRLLERGMRHYVPLPFETSLLVVGRTGSGKSFFLRLLSAKIALNIPNVSITICDYKKSSFAQFSGLPNFYGYTDVPNGIRAFYREFSERLAANDAQRNKQVKVLLLDEYGAMIQAQDKKESDELKTMIGNMLFMGRSLGIRVIIGIQRADSENFKAGARDQFGAVLGLGNLSKEQKQMLFTDYKDEMNEANGIGQGYLLVDGQSGIRRVIVPKITNPERVDACIREAVSRE